MNIVDMTHTQWREWTMNALIRSYMEPKMLDDLDVPPYWGKIDQIIIAGAGSSLSLIDKVYGKNPLVVANQSSIPFLAKYNIPIDIVTHVDPSKVAAEKLIKGIDYLYEQQKAIAFAPFEPVFIAGYHVVHDLGNYLFGEDDEKLHPLYYVPMYSQNAPAFNEVLRGVTDMTKSYLYQVGNVVNGAILIMNVLANLGKIPKAPIVLVGCDLSFGKEGADLYEHIEEPATVEPTGGYFVKDGETVDVKFVLYEEQLKIVVQSSQLPVYIHNPGSRLEKIVTPWGKV